MIGGWVGDVAAVADRRQGADVLQQVGIGDDRGIERIARQDHHVGDVAGREAATIGHAVLPGGIGGERLDAIQNADAFVARISRVVGEDHRTRLRVAVRVPRGLLGLPRHAHPDLEQRVRRRHRRIAMQGEMQAAVAHRAGRVDVHRALRAEHLLAFRQAVVIHIGRHDADHHARVQRLQLIELCRGDHRRMQHHVVRARRRHRMVLGGRGHHRAHRIADRGITDLVDQHREAGGMRGVQALLNLLLAQVGQADIRLLEDAAVGERREHLHVWRVEKGGIALRRSVGEAFQHRHGEQWVAAHQGSARHTGGDDGRKIGTAVVIGHHGR